MYALDDGCARTHVRFERSASSQLDLALLCFRVFTTSLQDIAIFSARHCNFQRTQHFVSIGNQVHTHVDYVLRVVHKEASMFDCETYKKTNARNEEACLYAVARGCHMPSPRLTHTCWPVLLFSFESCFLLSIGTCHVNTLTPSSGALNNTTAHSIT